MTASPLRVCHLVSDDGWGGAEVVIAGLLDAQAALPALSIRLVALNDARLCRHARALGLPVEVLPEADHGFPALARGFARSLARTPADVVHSHRYKENLLSYVVSPRRGAGCVVTLHGHEPPEGGLARFVFDLRLRAGRVLAGRARARFAAVSNDLRQRLGLPPERCRVIPNGVRIPPERPLRRWDHAPVIGWTGRLVPIKGLDVVLRALPLLPERWRAARLRLVGDGPERARLTALAKELGIADRVALPGFVEDTAAELARMDVFVFPSHHEGIPMALLEALAAGVPCVAARVGGIPEIVGDSEGARLVGDHEPASWAAALASVLDEPAEAARTAARGRERVAEAYALPRVAAEYLALYREAADFRS